MQAKLAHTTICSIQSLFRILTYTQQSKRSHTLSQPCRCSQEHMTASSLLLFQTYIKSSSSHTHEHPSIHTQTKTRSSRHTLKLTNSIIHRPSAGLCIHAQTQDAYYFRDMVSGQLGHIPSHCH
uniref:Uncharacterized protein n=1 Tax=Oryza brachyantha TaxID=4533 RepID=J3L8M1_ORYBR